MYEAYRVLKRFSWRGWTFAPATQAKNLPRERCGGDIWLVEAGHPRKAQMLTQRFAAYDAAIPPIDELLKSDVKRTLEQPEEPVASRSHK